MQQAHIVPFVPPTELCRGASVNNCGTCAQYGLAMANRGPVAAFNQQRRSPFVQCDIVQRGSGALVPEHKINEYSHRLRDLWKTQCLAILNELKGSDKYKYFHQVVSAKTYQQTVVENYYQIIKHATSFDEIRKGLDNSRIVTPDQFIDEMRQIFINCFTYNKPMPAMGDKDPYEQGKQLSLKFEHWVESLRYYV